MCLVPWGDSNFDVVGSKTADVLPTVLMQNMGCYSIDGGVRVVFFVDEGILCLIDPADADGVAKVAVLYSVLAHGRLCSL